MFFAVLLCMCLHFILKSESVVLKKIIKLIQRLGFTIVM